MKLAGISKRLNISLALSCALLAFQAQAGSAQDIPIQGSNSPEVLIQPNMNPYQSMPAPITPQQGTSTTLPWPWNPVGPPPAPASQQTLPSGGQPPTPQLPWNVLPSFPNYNPSQAYQLYQAPSQAPPAPSTVPTTNTGAPEYFAPGAAGSSSSTTGGGAPASAGAAPAAGTGNTENPAAPTKEEKKKTAAKEKGKKKNKSDKDSSTNKDDANASDQDEDEDQTAEKEEKKPEFTATTYDPIREALFQLNSKQYAKSLDTLNRLLSNNPNNARAHYVRAVVYVMMRQYAQATSDYKEVLRLSPGSELGIKAADGLKKINL